MSDISEKEESLEPDPLATEKKVVVQPGKKAALAKALRENLMKRKAQQRNRQKV